MCVCAYLLLNRTFAFCMLFVGSRMITHRTLPPISLQPIYHVYLRSFQLSNFLSFSSTRFFILLLHTFLPSFTPHQRVSNPTIKQNHPKFTLTLWSSSSGQSTDITTEDQVHSQAFHVELLDKTKVGLFSL